MNTPTENLSLDLAMTSAQMRARTVRAAATARVVAAVTLLDGRKVIMPVTAVARVVSDRERGDVVVLEVREVRS